MDIEQIKRKMLIKYPFFGSIVANSSYKEDNSLKTAATDGEVIYYNKNFFENLSSDEQVFVMSHEVCHIAFNHILRSDGKNQKLWNIATDAVINAFLKKDGLKMVEGGVDIADAINYDAETLYEKLLKEQEQKKQGKNNSQSNGEKSENQSQSGDSGSSTEQNGNSNSSNNNENGNNENTETNDDVGHDTHDMWKEAVKKYKEQQNNNSDNEEKDNNVSKEKEEIEKKQQETEQLGEKDSFKKNKEEKKKQLEKLKKELTKDSINAGKTTNEDIIRINDIGRARPIIDWRYALRDAINYDVDWSYKNAYIEDGIVSARLEEQQIPETEIVLDTSGSIDETLLKNFLKECKNILQYTKLKVGCFDTKFYGFNEIRCEEDIDKMRFVGGGGTDFNTAINAFSRRVENKIIFTDGEADMPEKSLDAIWIVFGNEEIKPKGGRVIQITKEQLERLYTQEDNYYKGKSR